RPSTFVSSNGLPPPGMKIVPAGSQSQPSGSVRRGKTSSAVSASVCPPLFARRTMDRRVCDGGGACNSSEPHVVVDATTTQSRGCRTVYPNFSDTNVSVQAETSTVGDGLSAPVDAGVGSLDGAGEGDADGGRSRKRKLARIRPRYSGGSSSKAIVHQSTEIT